MPAPDSTETASPLGRRQNQTSYILFTLVLLLGCCMRFVQLDRVELHFDEALSVLLSQSEWSEFFQNNIRFNSSPPGYILMLRAVLQFGHSEYFVRFLPALFGSASILVVYLISLRFSRPAYAAFAALLLAFSPQHILLSREFRVYEIGFFFGALALLPALKLLNGPNPRWAAITAIWMAIGIQIQYGLAPYYLSIMVSIALHALLRKQDRRGIAKDFLILCAITGLAVVFVYVTSLRAQFYPGRGSSYIGESGLYLLSGAVLVRIYVLFNFAFNGVIFSLLAALGIYFGLRARTQLFLPVFCLISFGFFIVMGVLNLYPFHATRQCIILTLPLYGLAAIGLEHLIAKATLHHSEFLLTTLLTLVLFADATMRFISPLYVPADNKQFSTAIQQLKAQRRAEDVLFLTPGSFPLFRYYAHDYPGTYIIGKDYESWMGDERAFRALAETPRYIQQLQDLANTTPCVWVFESFHLPKEPNLKSILDAQQPRPNFSYQTVLESEKVILTRITR